MHIVSTTADSAPDATPPVSLRDHWLEACQQTSTGFSFVSKVKQNGRSPRWSTPIDVINDAVGGAYGLTTLSGTAGAGKSQLALGTAILSALRDDVPAVYVAAEMTRGQVEDRLLFLARAHGFPESSVQAAVEDGRLVLMYRKGPISWLDFERGVGAALAGTTTALLVLDSINSLLASMVESGGSDMGYWQLFRRIADAIIDTRRSSEGKLCGIIISELNKDGVSRGRGLEYWSDLAVKLTATKLPRVVDVHIDKTREAGRDGAQGAWRITHNGTWVSASGETEESGAM